MPGQQPSRVFSRWLLVGLLFTAILQVCFADSPDADVQDESPKQRSEQADPGDKKPKTLSRKAPVEALSIDGVRKKTSNPLCPGLQEKGRRFTFLSPLLAATIGAAVVCANGPGALIAALLVPVFGVGAYMDFKATQYSKFSKENAIDVDAYTCDSMKLQDRAKVAFLHTLAAGSHPRSTRTIPLASASSPYVDGLKVTSNLDTAGEGALPLDVSSRKSIVVGTIRMGFGHHRIAYSAASWGLQQGANTVFHDLLAIESPEADLIRRADKMYSQGSRLASELGGVVEQFWGSMTKSGDQNSLRVNNLFIENLRPLLLGIPKDTPIIATHCFVGHCAVACGFHNVINLVIDNYPQWFTVVPGAINLVQGPTNFAYLQKMGVPADQIRLAGHWCPEQLVNNIEQDCAARQARAREGKPLRLLIPVGGAGAQRKFVTKFVEALKDEVESGRVQLMLNAGDHGHMRDAFLETFASMGLAAGAWETVDSIEGVRAYAERCRAGSEPPRGVTLFAFDDYFPAVATTDILSRVADVLCSKPSELAFYPLPKLNIRRVGDHEASSALRASELGDGTLEVREVEEALDWVRLFRRSPGVLDTMNAKIVANAKQGVYDGCKEAVQLALELAEAA